MTRPEVQNLGLKGEHDSRLRTVVIFWVGERFPFHCHRVADVVTVAGFNALAAYQAVA